MKCHNHITDLLRGVIRAQDLAEKSMTDCNIREISAMVLYMLLAYSNSHVVLAETVDIG